MKKLKICMSRSFLFHCQRDLLALVFVAFAASPLLHAQSATSPLLIEFATGLVGKQVRLTWVSEPGAQYRIEKSSDLAGSWAQVALVDAAATQAEWLDPEKRVQKGFYRISKPQPQVFSLEPPVISSLGGDIFVRGQALPPGAMLRLDTDPPIFLNLEPVPGQPGVWRASLSPGAVGGITGGAIAGRIVDANGVTICPVDQTIQITADGFAADAPPSLPPGAPQARSKQSEAKSNSKAMVSGPDDDCDGDTSVMAIWASRRGYDYYRAQSDMAAAGTHHNPAFQESLNAGEMPHGRDKLKATTKTQGDFNLSNRCGAPGIVGEVTVQACSLSLETPAGPPLDCVLTYRSMVASGSTSFFGPNWTCAYDISVTPVPASAGSSATQVKVCDGAGRCDTYTRQTDGSFTCDGMFRRGSFSGNTFTLTFADSGRWVFCPFDGLPNQGKILSIIDRNNVALTCDYDAKFGLLNSVSSQFGQSLSFTRNGTGQVSHITDHTGRFCTFSYFASGLTDGNPGMLQACSSPQVDGLAPVAGDCTFTYTTGSTQPRCDDNLLACRDGAGRLISSFAYSPSTNPLDVDFDRVVSERCSDSSAVPPSVCTYTAVSGGLLVCDIDELGRLTEYSFDKLHRLTRGRQYTGFSTPGSPVTPTSNRPTGKLRSTDLDFYETTCAYNAQHCPTVVTAPDGLQTRCTYQYDLTRSACPVSERGNVRVCTLVSPANEMRTVSMEYLPGFGGPEPGTFKPGGPVKGISVKCGRNPGADAVNQYRKGWDGSVKGNIMVDKGWDGSVKGNIMMDKGWDGSIKGNIAMDKGWDGSIKGNIARNEGWDVGEDGGGGTARVSLNFAKIEFQYPPQKEKARSRYVRGNLGSSGQDGVEINLSRIHVNNIGSSGQDGVEIKFRTSMSTTLGQKFTWGYDGNGNCTNSRPAIAGAGEDRAYNSLGQCTSEVTLNGPGSSFTAAFSYDADTHFCSSVVSDSTGLSLTESCARDALGRVTSTTDARGYDTLFSYNALDLCVQSQSPPIGSSRIATDYFYDAGGLPTGCDVEHRDATGALVSANPAYSTRYLRESPTCPFAISRVAVENRPTSLAPGSTDLGTSLGNFDVCDSTYNPAGECIEERTPAVCLAQTTDVVSSFTFDERGMLHRCISGTPGTPAAVTTECDYTPAGDLSRCATLAFSSADSPTETFLYDSFRRCVSYTDAMGNVRTYAYDNQGHVTCSLYGELNDVPGSEGNVLLANVRFTMKDDRGFPLDISLARRNGGTVRGSVIINSANRCASPFFDVITEDETITVDRFSPGTNLPAVQDITTVDRSPAGLVMSVTTNGDTLETNTYDTAGRLASVGEGSKTVKVCLMDRAGNVTSCTRTDFPTAGGNPVLGDSCSIEYDALNRPVQVTEGSNVTSCDYDSLCRTTRCSPPTGAPVFYDYDGGTAAAPFSVRTRCDVDGNGSLETLGSSYCRSGYTMLKPDGTPVRATCGSVASKKHVANFKWTSGRCANGACRSITDSNGATTTFTSDSQGRCVQTDFADGTQESCTFDALGRMDSQTRQNGAYFVISNNLNGQVTQVETGPCKPPYMCLEFTVPATTYGYNGRGDCVAITQGSSIILTPRDSYGNARFESQNGRVVEYTYNHRGRTSITYPMGARYNENRNAQGQLTSITLQGATPASPPIASFQYVGDKLVQETRANGVVTTHLYRGPNNDPAQQGTTDFTVDDCVQSTITGPTGNVLSRTTYARDRNQQLVGCQTLFSGESNATSPLRRQQITRDLLGRLTRMRTTVRATAGTAPPEVESDVTYSLDLEGKRLTASGGENPGSYTQTLPPGDLQMHQYSTWPGGDLIWNPNGDLTQFSHGSAGSQQFAYDSLSRLVSVSDTATGATVATYGYDAENRLISRTIPSSEATLPPVTTFFIYDGDRCIQELDSNGTPQLTHAAMGLCIVPINGDPIYPHGGGFSSGVSLMTGNTGAALEHFTCDDGGKPIFLDSAGVLRADATTAVGPIRWMAPECLWSPEARLFQCPSGAYCPDLGQQVSHKVTPKVSGPKSDGKKEYVGHVTLMK